jgi:hypothetical protein
VFVKRKGAKEGRRRCHGVHGGTNIVSKARQCQSFRASAATDAFLSLKDHDRPPGPSKNDRRS